MSGIGTRQSASPAPYNEGMNAQPNRLLLTRLCGAVVCLIAAGFVSACSTTPGEGVDKRIERLEHEDDRSRIQELRVGGQTESIDVQPKNGAPAYQVGPSQNTPSPSEGRSFWRLFEF